ncbi:MAG: hypothetical protein R3A48_20255 [Polyangiales bacterium]
MRSLVLCALASACAHAAAAPVAPRAEAPRASEPAVAAPLAARLREVREALAPRGVTFQGNIAAAGFIAHNAHVVTAFDVLRPPLPLGALLASSGVHDSDAQLYDPDGDMLVEDVEIDSAPDRADLRDRARRVFHMISAYEGQGAYVVASFVTERERLEAIARVVGGHPGTAGVAGPARSELERRVSALRDGIARRGFQPTGDPARFALSAGGRVRAPFPVTGDRCFTFGAFADGGLAALRLSIVDAAGAELARDRRGERDGLAQVCPRASTTLAVEAEGVRGEGAVVFQAWSADAAAIGGGSALWLGERLDWQGSATDLDETARRGGERLAALGLRPSEGAPERLTLAAGDLVERALRVRAAGCTAVLASAGRGAGRVDVSLHGADGALAARGEASDGGTLAVVCAPGVESLSLRVSLEAGGGELSVRSFEGAAPAWMNGLDAANRSEAWAALWRNPSPRWVLRGSPARVRVGAGARPMQSLEREGGRCARAALVAATAMPSLTLSARTVGGAFVNRSVGEGAVQLSRCGDAAESLRVELATAPATAGAVDGLWMVWDEHATPPAPAP